MILLAENKPYVYGGFIHKAHILKLISLQKLVKLELCSDHFPSWLCHPEGSQSGSYCLDGARPPPKYAIA